MDWTTFIQETKHMRFHFPYCKNAYRLVQEFSFPEEGIKTCSADY